ncbi:hypothetical protein [Myceligenerans pegani]|uniref:Transcriptional regulator n=1 Tax=Myceligenerans pegani TaxID=2776917 RepID=A0ABR9MSW5_9MICO|nr:hypothetical protein [Myceligenerans sp. TRM 65318]MBE1874475.1 hypothetical protein [Myceligenerans sp. TRM 65318]MBE3016746.1 hypothetical protein [Myceligenerans sp. TRM 65318]
MARSEKAGRDAFRAALLESGKSWPQIAVAMGERYRVRPRTAWRLALDLTLWQVVQRYLEVNPGAKLDSSRVSRWESWPIGSGGTRPRVEHIMGLARAFGHGCTVRDLIDDADLARYTPAERQVLEAATLDPPVLGNGLARRARSPQLGVASETVRAAAAQAARESWDHLASIAIAIDPIGMEMLHDQVRDLSRAYTSTTPVIVLEQARRTRNLAIQMLDQTKVPAQQMDLYLAAGMSCALLASSSFDLGQSTAATAQTRAALRYADLSGHSGLRAWSNGFAGLLAYWDGRPGEAVEAIEAALPHAPGGAATARLQAIRARAWALQGEQRQVTRALGAADEALGSGATEELHDEFGGEFGWDQHRHDMCAGTALVQAGDPQAAAERLAVIVDTDGSRVADRARVDLASARLADRDLSGAIDALSPVWSTPVDQRRFGLTSRLDGLAATLVDSTWTDHAPAGNLRDQIVTFNEEAAAHRATLAGLPGAE